MTKPTENELFEQLLRKQPDFEEWMVEKVNGEYKYKVIGAQFEVWQARAELADKEIAELQAAQQQSAGEILNLISVKEAKEFWKSVYEDGVTLQDMANELYDMHIMLENVPKVYCEVTGGKLSKHNYLASSVIGEFNNYVESVADEVRAEYAGEIAELKADNVQLQAQINELREGFTQLTALKFSTASHIQKLDAVNKIAEQSLAKTAQQCLIQHDNEVLERAAEIAENEYINYKLTEEAHYRHSSLPFLPSNFCFNMEIVHKSKNDAEAIRALKV